MLLQNEHKTMANSNSQILKCGNYQISKSLELKQLKTRFQHKSTDKKPDMIVYSNFENSKLYRLNLRTHS